MGFWFGSEYSVQFSNENFLSEGITDYLSEELLQKINKTDFKSRAFKILTAIGFQSAFQIFSERSRFNSIIKDLSEDSNSCLIDYYSSDDIALLCNDEAAYLKPKFLMRNILNQDSLIDIMRASSKSPLKTFSFTDLIEALKNQSNANSFKILSTINTIPIIKMEMHSTASGSSIEIYYSTSYIKEDQLGALDANTEILNVEIYMIDQTDTAFIFNAQKFVINPCKPDKKHMLTISDFDSSSFKGKPKCVVVDPYNKHYIFPLFDIDSLNYLIESKVFLNTPQEDFLLVKVVNDLFYAMHINKLDSIFLVTFIKRLALRKCSEINQANPLVIGHILSIAIHTIKNFFFENHQSSGKSFFFKLISERLFNKESLFCVKGILTEYLLDLIDTTDSDQMKFFMFLIFKENLEDKSLEESVDNQTGVGSDSEIKKLELDFCSRSTRFKVFTTLFESSALYSNERKNFEKCFNIFNTGQRLFLLTCTPDNEIKSELALSFCCRYYDSMDKEDKSGITNEAVLLMRAFNRRNQYSRTMKVFLKKRFFRDFVYVLKNYDADYAYKYYLNLNSSEIVSFRCLEKYQELQSKYGDSIKRNARLGLEFYSDLSKIKHSILIANSIDNFVSKDSEI